MDESEYELASISWKVDVDETDDIIASTNWVYYPIVFKNRQQQYQIELKNTDMLSQFQRISAISLPSKSGLWFYFWHKKNAKIT